LVIFHFKSDNEISLRKWSGGRIYAPYKCAPYRAGVAKPALVCMIRIS